MVWVRVVLCAAVLCGGGPWWANAGERQARRPELDGSISELRVNCAVRCLYVLSGWLGQERTFEEVCDAFEREPTVAGVSVEELLDAADRLGLSLTARRMTAREAAKVASAVIVLIPSAEEEGVGHFIVARPVGGKEGVWQVLDPDATPMLTTPYSVFGQGELVVLLPCGGRGFLVGGVLVAVAAGAVALLGIRHGVKRLGARRRSAEPEL